VRKAPGGDIVVNPSDPDATLDGHKGSGYQVQLGVSFRKNNKEQQKEQQRGTTKDMHSILHLFCNLVNFAD
jgi:hypothetical protein